MRSGDLEVTPGWAVPLMPELSSLGNVKPTAAGGAVRLDLDLSDAALIALIESFSRGHVALRVSNTGGVSNAPGKVPISGANPSAGTYTLTAPVGWRWHAAVGGGNNLSSVRTVTTDINAGNPRVLNVAVFSNTGTLTSVSFDVVGLVVPA